MKTDTVTEKHIPAQKALTLRSPGQSVESYIAEIKKIPLLTPEQERELAIRHYEQQDVEATRILVMSHLRFVVHIARTYTGYGLPLADLIQEGNVGLMKAIKRFDPYVGVHVVSFAVHWIRAEMHEYILRNWRLVKVATTKAQRKLFFNLRSATKKNGWLNEEEIARIAHDLGVNTDDVREMEGRMSLADSSFDGPIGSENEEVKQLTPANYLEDTRYDPGRMVENSDWSDKSHEVLHKALETLDERSRDILQQRWLSENSKVTLHDLARKYNISAERVRQVEASAMVKIRHIIQSLDSSIGSSTAFAAG